MSGLTLIEILVVVTILGIIASIVGIQVAGQLEEAPVDTAKVQISNISDGLELYRVKFNRYPTSAEGLNALTSPPKGQSNHEKIPKTLGTTTIFTSLWPTKHFSLIFSRKVRRCRGH